MNKIKIMAGQKWLYNYSADAGDNLALTVSYLDVNVHFTSGVILAPKILRSIAKFIPKTDSEWLAVNVDKWDWPDGYSIRRDGDVFATTNSPGYTTKQQWREKRIELGLYEISKSIDRLQEGISSLVDNANSKQYSEKSGRALFSEKESQYLDKVIEHGLDKARQDETEMKEEIRIPVNWLNDKGIKIKLGVSWRNEDSDCRSEFTSAGAFAANNKEVGRLFITEFTNRENTGEQPVADWVPVDVVHSRGTSWGLNAFDYSWVKDSFTEIQSWKPNIEELYKIYMAEQEGSNLNAIKEIHQAGEAAKELKRQIEGDAIKEERMNEKSYVSKDALIGKTEEHVLNVKAKNEKPKVTKGGQGKLAYISNFVFKHGIILQGEKLVDCIIRELTEKHDIDMRADEEKTLDSLVNQIEGIQASGLLSAEFLAHALFNDELKGVKWVGE